MTEKQHRSLALCSGIRRDIALASNHTAEIVAAGMCLALDILADSDCCLADTAQQRHLHLLEEHRKAVRCRTFGQRSDTLVREVYFDLQRENAQDALDGLRLSYALMPD